MGVYYSQVLKVAGQKAAIRKFIDCWIERDDSGKLTDIRFNRTVTAPDCLPDDHDVCPLGSDIDLGVEALTGAPRVVRIEGVAHPRPSALASPLAKELGLTDCDQLRRYLETNRPEALAAGAAAIHAHQQTGFWSRQEWLSDDWGEPLLEDVSEERLTDRRFLLRFVTKDWPIGHVLRRMGSEFPTLTFRLAALGDECAYVARSDKGRFSEEYVDETDKFVIEVEGKLQEDEDVCELPPRPRRPTKPHLWFFKWRVRRAIRDYPLYDPPHKRNERKMPEAMALENFAYFMRVRHERIAILRAWFRRHFFFDLRFEPKCAYRLNAWMRRYGPFLIDDSGNSPYVFASYQPAWVGDLAGYNLLFDIGIFLGEYAIAKRPQLFWEMHRGSKRKNFRDREQRPVLHGFASCAGSDPLSLGESYAWGLRQYTDIGSPTNFRNWRNDRIIVYLKFNFYMASRAADDTSPIRSIRDDRLE